jgi:NAD(P)-dependent dehydrogenase (short-subunit alcohol dehydrogenase family)
VMGPGGVIVSIASVLAQAPQPQSALYTATKAAVIGFTRGLALELGPRGIRAVSVSPGDIVTDSSQPPAQDEAGPARPARSSVLNRRGDVSEIADVVTFLLGSGASYITGTDLLVDGGYLLS